MTRRTKALQFDNKTAMKIVERDQMCIFCKIGFHLKSTSSFDYQISDIMHIVNKSQGGLGIEQNGVLGCRYHHSLLDNGNKGLRDEMISYIENYMIDIYPNWDKKDLVYKK